VGFKRDRGWGCYFWKERVVASVCVL